MHAYELIMININNFMCHICININNFQSCDSKLLVNLTYTKWPSCGGLPDGDQITCFKFDCLISK